MKGDLVTDRAINNKKVLLQGGNTEESKDLPYRHPPFGERYLPIFQSLKSVFDELFPSPLERWENRFRQAELPHSDMFVWLMIAGRYLHFTQGRNLSLGQKRNIFGVIYGYTYSNDAYATSETAYRTLSESRVKQIIDELDAVQIPPLLVDELVSGKLPFTESEILAELRT
jgi:hypothetical protein